MRSTVQAEIDRLRTERAAEWLEILREGTPEAHAEFVQWITESPLNLDEFLKVDALSREMREVLSATEFDRKSLLQAAASSIVHLHPAAQESAPPNRRARLSWLPAAIAATLVVISVLGYWSYRELGGWDSYVAGPTEQRRIELPDGSRVHLNANTELAVRLSDQQRELRLRSGEALFDVAKDPLRPFRVQTNDALVEVVGTQFNVNARSDGTRVAVIEGKVRVSRGDLQDPPTDDAAISAVAAGEAVRITPAGTVERDRVVSIATLTAWSRPQLVFEGTPLEQAVDQFNRHGISKRLRLEGVEPGSHHYTGLFDASDSEAFAELLSRERDLQVEVRDLEIVIRPRR